MTLDNSIGLKTILARHSITSFLFVDGVGNKTLTLQRFTMHGSARMLFNIYAEFHGFWGH
jgi:hypothetical protein